MAARTTLVSYTVNGVGLGHVQRQLGIHAWLRRLCGVAGLNSQHAMITTSEASELADDAGVATFKLPSKSGIERAGFDKLSYLALAKQWTWTALSTLRPDIFVVDTFAAGSFHELPAALDLARHRVLVYRPAKDIIAQRPEFIAAAQLYDLIVVPANEDHADIVAKQLRVPTSRLRMVGPVMRHDRFEAFDRPTARRMLGIDEQATVVLVSGGGGGDITVDATVQATIDAVAALNNQGAAPIHLVIAAGPLHRGAATRGPHCTWLTDAKLPLLWSAIDVAISAAGYNSVHELAHAGVPTLLLPQDKIADDQHARAAAMAAAGAAEITTQAGICSSLSSLLLDHGRRAAMGEAGPGWVPHNHASDAAVAILELLLPARTLADARHELTDEVITAVESSDWSWTLVRDVAATLMPMADDSVPMEQAVSLLRSCPWTTTQLLSVGRMLHKRCGTRDRPGERHAAIHRLFQVNNAQAIVDVLQTSAWDRPPDVMAIAHHVAQRCVAVA
jgi:UDP-N-acetylglucosamine--N-acetylmuramyl-(pentapeptide) pyrophosphoryl-undecaprenol N-acetylglucosamine transferase